MKILVVANKCKWKSWERKLWDLRQWFSPIEDSQITLKETNYSSIPWQDYTNAEGVSHKGIDNVWFDENISKPAKLEGYDTVIFTVPLKDWQPYKLNPNNYVEAMGTGNDNGIDEIQIGCDEKGDYNFLGVKLDGDKWTNIAIHELTHKEYKHQGKVDNTHAWYLAGKPENCLIELKKEPKKTVVLVRNKDNGVQTTGILALGGFTCNTLELAWKENKSNISCIPEGLYDVVWSFSLLFGRYTYEITKVPNRSGIRLHSGNFFFDLKGCILLGNGYKDINGDKNLDIINSKDTLKKFEEFMKKEPFTLRIL